MSKRIILTAIAVLCCAVAAAPAFAGKGSRTQATISFASVGNAAKASPSNGSTVSFAVSSSLASKTVLVVTNRCWRDGVVVYNEYHAVSGGGAGPFTINAGGAAS